jgi:hypothetical protein
MQGRTLRRVAALGLGVAMLGVAGCGGDDEESGGDAQTQAAEPTTAAFTISGTPTAPKLAGPSEVKAGLVTITTKNDLSSGADMQLVRVAGDKTAADVLKITNSDTEGQPIPAWLEGGAGTGQTKAGGTGKATQVLEPGRYFAIASGDTEGEGKPATLEINVTGEAAEGELPAADGSIAASEYAFAAQGLTAGTNPVRFVNNGKELHHVIAFPLAQGKTLEDAKKAFMEEGEPSGPPPVDFENAVGTAVIDGGEEQVVDLNLKSGKYVLVSFITDRKGGPPHVAKGMISEAEVQ